MKLTIFLFLCALCECTERKSNWWEHTTIYDIRVWSYKDSNNDGLGDIRGIIMKLDYLKELGISTIKLSQIFSSPDEITNSYAVDDFYKIHFTLGNMNDFDELIKEVNSRGIKLLLDINLKHCHASNNWFKNSIENIPPYKDYFIWENGKFSEILNTYLPPKYGRNVINRSAWKWSNQRKKFYYNTYNYLSPNFNLDNLKLQLEIQEIFLFWFNKGISGLNILDVNANAEDDDKILKLIRFLRKFVDDYNKSNIGNERILMTEIKKNHHLRVSELFGSEEQPIFHFVSTSGLRDFNIRSPNPVKFFTEDLFYLKIYKSVGIHFEWMLESESQSRMAKPNGKETSEVLLMIQSFLPGIMGIYYGAELGMSEHLTSSSQCVDFKWEYRNTGTLPMQWDTTINAGFSNNECVLQEPNPDYTYINVEMAKKDKFSTYNFVKNLLKLRQNEILQRGGVEFSRLSNTILIITRICEAQSIYAILSFNNVPEVISLPEYMIKFSNNFWKILIATPNSFYQEGDKINPQGRFVMRPTSGIVVENDHL